MQKSKLLTACFLFLFLAGSYSTQAATKTWTGAVGTNDWFVDGNWNAGVGPAPVAGDDVVITNVGAAVLLTNSTPYLGSLTISNTLVFSNWNTKLSATNVTIQSGGIITLPVSFTTNQMSNNVYFVCSNFMLLAGGKINVDGLGYTGGLASASSPAGDGQGPGAGVANGYGIGAGYGGRGGPYGPNGGSPAYDYPGAHPYGFLTAPTDPGSGGGGSAGSGGLTVGGAGGGAVRIDAPNGNVIVSGTITANGTSGSGGGSGGSIYITCRTFDGTNGVLSAKGGSGYPQHNTGGHGGGGRISVIYNIAAQTAVPMVSFLANPGSLVGQYGAAARGDPGTIYLPDNKFITAMVTNFYGQVWGFSSLSFSTFTVSNTWVRFPTEGFQLTATGDLTVKGSSGMLQLGGGTTNNAYQFDPRYQASGDYWYGPVVSGTTSPPILNVGGNLVLTNSGSLVLFSAMTNAGPGTTNYGALVSVTNDILIANGSALYPYSHPTNGGSVWIQARNVSVASGGTINANGKGFAGAPGSGYGYGPGGSVYSYYWSGAGYGGAGGGGINFVFGGSAYGSVIAPADPGSGSGTVSGGGGGLIRILAASNVTVNGTLTAEGIGAGGAGGGIYITCQTFSGTSGVVSVAGGANGGTHPGAGGGGRMAIVYNTNLQSSSAVTSMVFNASGGSSSEHPGDLGTLYFPDAKFLSERLVGIFGKLWMGALSSWSANSLMVSNSMIRFAADGFNLTVTNDLLIGASGRLELGGPVDNTSTYLIKITPDYPWRLPFAHGTSVPPVLAVGGNLVVNNGGSLYVYSAPANLPASPYGALVNVAGDVILTGSNSWICPLSHPTNGGSMMLRAMNLRIDPYNGIDASGKGFGGGYAGVSGWGPGHGVWDANYPNGASYGGRGGSNVYFYLPSQVVSPTYGSSNAPVDPGSGAGNGGPGGGLIRINIRKTLTINGTINANAADATGASAASGGGIYIFCKTFAGGSGGLLTAYGGNAANANVGAGGGGRIAVWRQIDTSGGAVGTSVAAGTAPTWQAGPGTIVWGWLPARGTMISVP